MLKRLGAVALATFGITLAVGIGSGVAPGMAAACTGPACRVIVPIACTPPFKAVNGQCVCPPGFHQLGNTCATNLPPHVVCPPGKHLVNGRCVAN